MGKGKFFAVAVSTAALILAGCGTTSPEDLGGEVDSGIMHIPIPETAVANKPDLDNEDKGVWFVEDVFFEDVVDWYEDRLPIGERHEGFAFCRESGDPESGEWFIAWLWWDDDDEIPEAANAGLSVDIIGEYPKRITITVRYDPILNPDCP